MVRADPLSDKRDRSGSEYPSLQNYIQVTDGVACGGEPGGQEGFQELAELGIKTVVNGPITYTIDGAPLVGPVPGKKNAFCIMCLTILI